MTPSEAGDNKKLDKEVVDRGNNSVAPTSFSDIGDKYDVTRCIEWIKTRAIDKVCLQFPDYLIQDSVAVALHFEKLLEKKVYILGDTTCGSCCVDEVASKHIGADGIIHFGHACLNPTARLPVFHVLPKNDINVEIIVEAFDKFFTNFNEKIVIFYDISYSHVIERIWNCLSEKYNRLAMSTLNCTSNIEFVDTKIETNLLISGRSWTLENGYKIEEYTAVFIGPNDRTLASLAMSIPTKAWYYTVGSEFYKFDVISNPWLRRRRFLVEKLKNSQTIGIVVATLGIKNYLDALSSLKQIFKEKKKKTYIFSIGKPNPAKLANFPEVDAFVVIACPESDIFDSKDYFKPLLTPFEVELAFNIARAFSINYCLDFRQILPGGSNYVEFMSSEKPDISLISNEIINSEEPTLSTDKMNALSCKEDGTVAIGKSGANFLVNRSWQGLEQRIGEDKVQVAEKGRCGLPVGYDNEPPLH